MNQHESNFNKTISTGTKRSKQLFSESGNQNPTESNEAAFSLVSSRRVIPSILGGHDALPL